jgi:hypothetical protein
MSERIRGPPAANVKLHVPLGNPGSSCRGHAPRPLRLSPSSRSAASISPGCSTDCVLTTMRSGVSSDGNRLEQRCAALHEGPELHTVRVRNPPGDARHEPFVDWRRDDLAEAQGPFGEIGLRRRCHQQSETLASQMSGAGPVVGRGSASGAQVRARAAHRRSRHKLGHVGSRRRSGSSNCLIAGCFLAGVFAKSGAANTTSRAAAVSGGYLSTEMGRVPPPRRHNCDDIVAGMHFADLTVRSCIARQPTATKDHDGTQSPVTTGTIATTVNRSPNTVAHEKRRCPLRLPSRRAMPWRRCMQTDAASATAESWRSPASDGGLTHTADRTGATAMLRRARRSPRARRAPSSSRQASQRTSTFHTMPGQAAATDRLRTPRDPSDRNSPAAPRDIGFDERS